MLEAEKKTMMEKERRNGKEVRKKISIEGMPTPSLLLSVFCASFTSKPPP